MRQNVLGIDLQRLVEEPHAALLVAAAAEYLALDLKSFGRARVGSNRPVNQLVGLSRFGSSQQPCELYFRPRGAGVELNGLVQERFGLCSIAQTRGRRTQRCPELTLEDRIPIARLHGVYEVGKFL